MPEGAIERERLGRGPNVEALSDDDLDAVAVDDELAGAAHALAELLGRPVRGHGPNAPLGLVR